MFKFSFLEMLNFIFSGCRAFSFKFNSYFAASCLYSLNSFDVLQPLKKCRKHIKLPLTN